MAAAAVEGLHKLKTGRLESLSEQELTDCDAGGEIHGCYNPGSVVEAFEFITKHGLASEYKYPYEGKNGRCNTKKKLHPKAKIMGYENVPINNETALLLAVAHL